MEFSNLICFVVLFRTDGTDQILYKLGRGGLLKWDLLKCINRTLNWIWLKSVSILLSSKSREGFPANRQEPFSCLVHTRVLKMKLRVLSNKLFTASLYSIGTVNAIRSTSVSRNLYGPSISESVCS